MKKVLFYAIAVILCIALLFALFPLVERSFDRGRVSNVELGTGASERFSQDEIASAMNVVKETFAEQRGWNDVLVSLWYSDNACSRREMERGGFDEDNTIVLFSDWYQGQGLFAERQPMPWTWILARESPTDAWVVIGGGKV